MMQGKIDWIDVIQITIMTLLIGYPSIMGLMSYIGQV